ncbi:MAG TPA: glutamate formimidoyltransferase [Bryobacteraceae bacterium]|nr:glutamate formimidoyltransferase [Bryobacteraceae bacterium]
MHPLIECVPNFSEGRDLARIDALESAIAGVPGTVILDRTSDRDHHRSVITFAGDPQPVVEAALRAVSLAAQLIDLNHHRGVHPRLGALDVLPFVPLAGATLEDCVALAHRAGHRIWNELGIPVYFYEAAALRPDRLQLEHVRRGQFEGLREAVLLDETKQPDLGGPVLHPTAGAVIVGARKVLIAYNIDLATPDIEVAKQIARKIRASNGGFPAVKALGLALPSRNQVQVSMNLTDFEQTPVHVVYDEVSRLAQRYGIEIAGSELIGLLPRKAVELAFAHYLKLPRFRSGDVIEQRMEIGRSRTDV